MDSEESLFVKMLSDSDRSLLEPSRIRSSLHSRDGELRDPSIVELTGIEKTEQLLFGEPNDNSLACDAGMSG
jgi:hypothetical protein